MKKLYMAPFLKVLLSVILIDFLGACSEKELDPNDPVGSFAIAKEPYDDENYENAIKRLGEFKSRFPYSRFTALAELYIANSHYELEHFEEAALDYAQFVKLHPKHEEVEFAMYRIGESYWAEAPEAIDRDQEYTSKAIEEWRKLIAAFPEGKYSQQAKEKSAVGLKRLAEAMEFAANFYCKLEKYHACAYQFEKLLTSYPSQEQMKPNAYKKLVKSYKKLAEGKRQDPESDKNIFFVKYSAAELDALANQYQTKIK